MRTREGAADPGTNRKEFAMIVTTKSGSQRSVTVCASRTKTLTLAFGALALAATVSNTARADGRDFEFVNLNRSASIVQAWIAAAGTSEPWRPIGIYTQIAPRTTRRITVSGGTRCTFDLKIRFDDGYEQVFSDIDLCRTEHLVAN
jgi:hypothetical protein